MTANIERSPGIPISISGLMAGGGQSGATATLDDIVQSAAEALSALYGGAPVTIRFNSDRQSGGVWLKTAEKDYIGGNAEVGITASQYDPSSDPILFATLRRIALRDDWEAEYAERRNYAVATVDEAIAILRDVAVLNLEEIQGRIETLTARKNS